jgi:hypothetical protein
VGVRWASDLNCEGDPAFDDCGETRSSALSGAKKPLIRFARISYFMLKSKWARRS